MRSTKTRLHTTGLMLAAGAFALSGTMARADQVFADDLIVQGSACVGFDCVNGESFGFDTIRLKENNVRIKFQDTSTSGSFPTNDWQLTANDSANGGANKFSIDDIDNGRTPFTITAAARSNSIFVNSNGNVGFGTATPAVTLHARSGNTPTLRLEQDGSSGFTPQTWDLAGNETNFFVRDATNGSQLPLRIRPSAPSNSIFVDTDGDVGMGTASPGSINGLTDAAMHIRRTDGTASLKIEEAGGSSTGFLYMLEMANANAGASGVAYRMTNGTTSIDTNNIGGEYRINFDDGDNQELTLDAAGNMEIDGTLTQNSDKNAKMAIVPVDPDEILSKVAALPVSSWSYKDTAGVRHIGPMAQDFYALFGTGASETGISSVDTAGVALAAIKALSQENDELRVRLEALETRLAD